MKRHLPWAVAAFFVALTGVMTFPLSVAPGTLASMRLGEHVTLATSLVVRQDSLTLYGFADDDERQVFELVQTVSGIGPRLAQSMLAVHAPDALRRAVMTEDLVALMKVSGVGRKGAQRLVLELKDRLGPPRDGLAASARSNAGGGAVGADWQAQVHAALIGLGWTVRDADEAISAVAPEAAGESAPDVGALLKSALRSLSRA